MISQMRVSVKHRGNVYSRFSALHTLKYTLILSMQFREIHPFMEYLCCVHCKGKTADIFYWFYERKLLLGNISNTKKFSYLKKQTYEPYLLKVFWEIYLWVPDYEILGSFLIVVCNSSSDSAISHCMLDTRMRMYVYKICWYINHLRSLVFVISRRCSLGKSAFYSIQYNNLLKCNLAASKLFHVFIQSIKFCPFHCHISKSADVWNGWFIKETKNERLLL